MTMYLDCDYCGEAIVGKGYVSTSATGPAACSADRRTFHYHAEARGTDSCYDSAMELLERQRTMARGLPLLADPGLEWRLIPTRDSAIVAEPVHVGEETDVGYLVIPHRIYMALRRAGFYTIEAVERVSDHELLSKPGIGWVTVARVREAIEEYRADAAEKAPR